MKLVGNNINKLTPLEVSSVPSPFRLLGLHLLTKKRPVVSANPSHRLVCLCCSCWSPALTRRTAWHQIKRQVGSLSAWSCLQPMSQKLTSLAAGGGSLKVKKQSHA